MQRSLVIADDSNVLSGDLRQLVLRRGYLVETVRGGLECVSRLRQRMPDMLILKWNLPWGGGDGVLAWLREQGTDQPLPAVLVVGAENEGSQPSFDLPVVQHLPQSASAPEMLREISTMLQAVRS